MSIEILIDADALTVRAADLFVQASQEAVRERGQFMVALTGGSTPKTLYALLAQSRYAEAIPWQQTLVFEGDERCVPFDDERSNYGMAQRALLSKVPVPDGNLFPFPTDAGDPAQIAALYQQTLADVFAITPLDAPPVFDLILLGLGDDGHTCSLFPGMNTLTETAAWVISSPPGTLPPPVDRATFTFPVVNAARHCLFLVAGENKAEAVRDILEGGADIHRRPAAAVRPVHGELTWLLDKAAASLLKTTPS